MSNPHRFDLTRHIGINLMDGYLPPPITDWPACHGYFTILCDRITAAHGERALTDALLLGSWGFDEFDRWARESAIKATAEMNAKRKSK